MCRYEDGDYEWYVDGVNAAFLDQERRSCEDCGRIIEPSEVHTRYTKMLNEYGEDAPYVWVAQMLLEGQSYLDGRRPWTIVDDDRAESLEGDDTVFLDELPEWEFNPPPTEYAHQCAQCYEANVWLKRVCDQSTVMVTVEDLIEHRLDYTPDVLGPDFMTLVTLAQQRWRTRDFNQIIPVHVVSRLANDAADFAIAGGVLHP